MTDEEIIEEYGQETDDWLLDDDRLEFISFRDSPGNILVLFTGRPKKGRSKYAKEQFWFPCTQILDLDNGVCEDRILSTSSNQLRKRLTKIFNEYPDLFKGTTPVSISWIGSGMERKYSAHALLYEDKRAVMDKIGKGSSPESS